MRLEAGSFRYLTKEDSRILTAVEMGMKNHEYVPEQLVESIAHLRRCGVFGRIQGLMKHGLLCHEGRKADGYKLTYNGYDCLALRAMTNRGLISSIGTRIGVGKESDIHLCSGPKDVVASHDEEDDADSVAGSDREEEDGNVRLMVVKFHRLGRISFRAVKSKRDHLDGRSHASWLYLARLAAKKEYDYMKVLFEAGFPVPRPIDNSRHAVLMEYIEGSVPMYQLPASLTSNEIERLLDVIYRLLVRFAVCGLIHGDFNEFNLLVDLKDVEKVTVIDFPQIISIEHSEARTQFNRDSGCIKRFFEKRFRVCVEGPDFDETYAAYLANKEGRIVGMVNTETDDLLLRVDSDGEEIDEDEESVDGEEAVEDAVEEECVVEVTTPTKGEVEESSSGEDSSSGSSGEDEEKPKRERKPKEDKESIIQDPRFLLKAKKRLERRNAAPKIVAEAPKGKSQAKPNKQKRGQHVRAKQEAKAWAKEGGWA